MAFEWDVRPDDAKVVLLVREPTGEGLPCQVHAVIEFTEGGEVVGKRKLTINPGLLKDYGAEDGTAAFETLWDAIPEVSQAVKDAVAARLPNKMLRDLWQGRKG